LSPTQFLITMDDIIGRVPQNKEGNQIGFTWTVRGPGTQRLFLPAVTELQRHVRENGYHSGGSSHSCIKMNSKKANELWMNSSII